ncbi:unnamed protein product [Hapterophycus canaliculatus]
MCRAWLVCTRGVLLCSVLFYFGSIRFFPCMSSVVPVTAVVPTAHRRFTHPGQNSGVKCGRDLCGYVCVSSLFRHLENRDQRRARPAGAALVPRGPSICRKNFLPVLDKSFCRAAIELGLAFSLAYAALVGIYPGSSVGCTAGYTKDLDHFLKLSFDPSPPQCSAACRLLSQPPKVAIFCLWLIHL